MPDARILDIINEVWKQELPSPRQYTPVTSMDTPLDIAGLDSLGVLLLFMRVEEEFDISSEKVDELMLKNPLTAMDIKNYIN